MNQRQGQKVAILLILLTVIIFGLYTVSQLTYVEDLTGWNPVGSQPITSNAGMFVLHRPPTGHGNWKNSWSLSIEQEESTYWMAFAAPLVPALIAWLKKQGCTDDTQGSTVSIYYRCGNFNVGKRFLAP